MSEIALTIALICGVPNMTSENINTQRVYKCQMKAMSCIKTTSITFNDYNTYKNLLECISK